MSKPALRGKIHLAIRKDLDKEKLPFSEQVKLINRLVEEIEVTVNNNHKKPLFLVRSE